MKRQNHKSTLGAAPSSPSASPLSPKRKAAAIGAGCLCASVLLFAFFGKHTTPDFLFLVISMIALCGVVVYDTLNRHNAMEGLSSDMQKLTHHHDRLMKETARNRYDIAKLHSILESYRKQARRCGSYSKFTTEYPDTITPYRHRSICRKTGTQHRAHRKPFRA